jgi:hypothetical protein
MKRATLEAFVVRAGGDPEDRPFKRPFFVALGR